MNNSDGICERICPVCGKTFVVSPYGWAYKKSRRKRGKSGYDYYCSHTCFMANEHAPSARRKPSVYLTNLRRVLDRLNLTYKKAGEMCGVSESNLTKYANLYAMASEKTVGKIAAGLGVTVDELVGDDGE